MAAEWEGKLGRSLGLHLAPYGGEKLCDPIRDAPVALLPPPMRRRSARRSATAGPHSGLSCQRPCPPADDSSLLAVLLDVSPAGLAHLAAIPGLGLQSLLQQVRRQRWGAGPLVLAPSPLPLL